MLYPDAQANRFPHAQANIPPFSGYGQPVQIIATDETGAVLALDVHRGIVANPDGSAFMCALLAKGPKMPPFVYTLTLPEFSVASFSMCLDALYSGEVPTDIKDLPAALDLFVAADYLGILFLKGGIEQWICGARSECPAAIICATRCAIR